MQRSIAVSILAACLSIAWPLGSAADLIVPVSQTRTVSASADNNPGNPSSTSFSAPGFAAFDAQATARSYDPNLNPGGTLACCSVTSNLRHRSTIEPDRLWVDGTGTAYYSELGSGTVSASLVYDVTFDLTALSSYDVITFFQTGGAATFSATLWDDSDNAIFSLGGFQSSNGSLAPGRYRFEVLLNRTGLGDSSPDGFYQGWADLTFTLIPEPASAPLLGTGLLLLAARRRYGRTTASV